MDEVTNQETSDNGGGDTAGRQDAPDTGTPTAGAAQSAGDDDSLLDEETKDSARYVNYQYFYGSVDAPGSAFGFAAGGAPGRNVSATGPLRPDEVSSALRCHVKPSMFAAAQRLLEQRRMVVLCGRDGIGKYAGAIALLREVAGREHLPTNLSPALTFTELAAQKFGNAGGYIVRDQLRDGNDSSVQQFEVHRLLGALKGRSYLVITTDLGVRPRGGLADLMVDWAPPDPVGLFDRCVTELLPSSACDPAVAQVREQIGQLVQPGRVVEIAGLLADRPAAALAALQETEQHRVIEWFARKPTVREVLTVAALAFVDGAPEPSFEQLLARLVELHRTVSGAPVAAAADQGEEGMEQSRAWSQASDLITVRRTGSDPDTTAERSICFISTQTRALAIRELHERYGYELWEPLRMWLHEVAARPMSFLQVRLGFGLALLARCTFSEVEHVFLDQWSAGLAPQRLAAASTLSWIGIDGTCASAALGIAKRWSRNSGPRRAATAATALGGPLGMRYSSDALRWLWLLAMRSAEIRQVACVGLGNLFSASANEVAATRRMLNFLRNRIDEAVLSGTSQRQRRAVFDTVLTIVSTGDPETAKPVAATVIARDRRNAARLGVLWAELVRSGPHSGIARRALVTTLESLVVTPDALPAVAELGAAVRTVLSTEQWRRLETTLDEEAEDRAGGPPDRSLLASVLAALRGRPAQPRTGLVRRSM